MRLPALLLYLLATPALAEEPRSVADIARDLTRQTGEVSALMDSLAGAAAVPEAPASPEAPAALPRIDAEAHCEEIAALSGGSVELQNYCIKSEQKAYNGLKGTWASYPERARAYCASLIPFTGSYEMLAFCLKQEAEAAGATKAFEY